MDLLFATKSVPDTIKTKMNHIHEACTQYLVTKILTCKYRNPSPKHKNRMQNKALASNQQSLVLLCIIELAVIGKEAIHIKLNNTNSKVGFIQGTSTNSD